MDNINCDILLNKVNILILLAAKKIYYYVKYVDQCHCDHHRRA